MEAHAHIGIAPAFLTQGEVSVLLGVPERTLEGWRLTKFGPPWLKFGRHVQFDRDDVLTWARGHVRTSSAETTAKRAPWGFWSPIWSLDDRSRHSTE
jgi:hypothetical protein